MHNALFVKQLNSDYLPQLITMLQTNDKIKTVGDNLFGGTFKQFKTTFNIFDSVYNDTKCNRTEYWHFYDLYCVRFCYYVRSHSTNVTSFIKIVRHYFIDYIENIFVHLT